MNLLEAVHARHSVRSYVDKPIPADVAEALQVEIDASNAESGLHLQLVTNESKAFDGMLAHYGKFLGVNNYIALAGKRGPALEEKLGYYGERVALQAQLLGLNTCWVAMSFKKGAARQNIVLDSGERLALVLALGYGATQGASHSSKPMGALCRVEGDMPGWFCSGMEAVMLAPTAMNQQRFLFTLAGDTVCAKALPGFYTKTDLGIAKFHFEVGAGNGGWRWG